MIKKEFLANKCRVTFEVPQSIANTAKSVYLVGDFNDWDESATRMERKKGHHFIITLTLDINCDYQYRFLVDGLNWYSDWSADKYVPNPFNGDNSVVSTYLTEAHEALV